MKTTVNFNKNNERVSVTDQEIASKTSNIELLYYLKAREEYSEFCSAQTKKGQARKNERARARHRIFANIDTTALDEMIIELREDITAEKESLIEKIKVEIEYDGRKKVNLRRIVEGVRMAIFVGGISPQYYGIGLVNFNIIK